MHAQPSPLLFHLFQFHILQYYTSPVYVIKIKIKKTFFKKERFAKEILHFIYNKKALEELDKKLKRLQKDPLHVGGWLSGELHGKKSTRITKRFRLIFTPDKTEKVVYLNWIDHREHVY